MFALAALAFMLNSFVPSVPVILWYLFSINIFTFLLFVIDRYYTAQDREVVPEFSLYFFSIAGGFIGAFLAIVIVRHKIKERVFLLWQGVILIIWLVVIYYVFNNFEVIQKTLQGLTNA
jgi:uncharacterized membrane protein YsdA (DUF1294 family)